MRIQDPHFTGIFPVGQEVNINDVISRLDIDIFMEGALSSYDPKKAPEMADPDIREMFAMDDAEDTAWDIFRERIKDVLPYKVRYSKRIAIAWCREYVCERLRIEPAHVRFEDEDDAVLFKLTWG